MIKALEKKIFDNQSFLAECRNRHGHFCRLLRYIRLITRILAAFAVYAGIFSTAFVSSPAQFNGSGWIWQNPLPQGNHLNSVRFAPGGRVGFSVGNDGTILWTKDGGFNWQMVEPLINTSFTSVYAIDEQTAIAVYYNLFHIK